jgi:HAD superfamily hydrolase (TIGR01490 family)
MSHIGPGPRAGADTAGATAEAVDQDARPAGDEAADHDTRPAGDNTRPGDTRSDQPPADPATPGEVVPEEARPAAEEVEPHRAAATVHLPDAEMRAGAATAEVEEALAVPVDLRAAAFFDVDNTIMRGASIFHLVRGLYRRKFFTVRDIARFAWQQTSFVLLGENMDHVEEAQGKALSFVAGRSVSEMRSVGEEIFDEIMADKIWPGTHALARMHLEAGQRVWLVTATPVEVAEVIADRLGLTGALGTVAEHVGDVYTGRLVGQPMHGPAKAEAVRALAQREGLDLARCAAYSDSANDIPLLSLVGHPCAINPDHRLRSRAHAEGWRVRDYRTGRKAAKIGFPAAGAIGVAVGAAVGATAASRRRRR